MLAVRLARPVGIDLEALHDLPQALHIARRYFTAAEAQLLASLRSVARRDGFLALWTRKEALVKAMGTSLAESLDRVEFEFNAIGRVQIVSLGGDRSSVHDWVVLGLDCGPDYVAALATARPLRKLQQFSWDEAAPVAARDHRNSAFSIAEGERSIVKVLA